MHCKIIFITKFKKITLPHTLFLIIVMWKKKIHLYLYTMYFQYIVSYNLYFIKLGAFFVVFNLIYIYFSAKTDVDIITVMIFFVCNENFENIVKMQKKTKP